MPSNKNKGWYAGPFSCNILTLNQYISRRRGATKISKLSSDYTFKTEQKWCVAEGGERGEGQEKKIYFSQIRNSFKNADLVHFDPFSVKTVGGIEKLIVYLKSEIKTGQVTCTVFSVTSKMTDIEGLKLIFDCLQVGILFLCLSKASRAGEKRKTNSWSAQKTASNTSGFVLATKKKVPIYWTV